MQPKITLDKLQAIRDFSNLSGLSFTESFVLFYGDNLFKLSGISKKSKALAKEFDDTKKKLYDATDRWDKQLYKADLELVELLIIQSLEYDLRAIADCTLFVD